MKLNKYILGLLIAPPLLLQVAAIMKISKSQARKLMKTQ